MKPLETMPKPQISVRVDPSVNEKINEYTEESDATSKAEATRRLIAEGLEAKHADPNNYPNDILTTIGSVLAASVIVSLLAYSLTSLLPPRFVIALALTTAVTNGAAIYRNSHNGLFFIDPHPTD